MEDLKIPNTAKTPGIEFNSVTGVFFISGISVPENSQAFYIPIIDWLKDFIKEPTKTIRLIIELSYINTSSLQFFYDILKLLDAVHVEKSTISVEWHYLEEDIDMKEMGEDFRDALSVDFSFFPVEDA